MPFDGSGTEVTSDSADETLLLGRLLGRGARPGDVLALEGGLGAGKTVLVKGLAEGLGVSGPVPSPTFNLLLVHPAEPTLYHFDLYRLERGDQLEDLDFFEIVEEAGGVAAIEWADRFPGEMPPDRLVARLEPFDETSRRLVLLPTGPHSARWLDAFLSERGAAR